LARSLLVAGDFPAQGRLCAILGTPRLCMFARFFYSIYVRIAVRIYGLWGHFELSGGLHGAARGVFASGRPSVQWI
jgi:hypothetical protein